MEKITVQTTIAAKKDRVWDFYTDPKHIIHWNFADPSWHCPSAENNMQIGGQYRTRMEAKDGSFGFDFDAIYTEVIQGELLSYEFGGRSATILFKTLTDKTEVEITFEPEAENALEMQKTGWQALLNNFKKYAESR